MQEVKNRRVKAKSGEEAVHFIPVLKGSDAVGARAPKIGVSVYQFALAGLDLILALFAFWIAARITGLGWLIEGQPAQQVCLFLLSLVLIAFFLSYHLYSYRYIFLVKAHLVNLLKALCWSILTLGMIFILYTYPQIFRGLAALLSMSAVAIILLLLSTFYWRYLINFLKAMGISFILAGIMAFLIPDEKPDVLYDWSTMVAGVAVGTCLFLSARFFLVHVVFGKWMRRYFRRQALVIGTNEEMTRITNHVVRLNAPFWIAGFVGSRTLDFSETLARKRRLGELRDLPAIVKKEKIDNIIVTDETIEKPVLISLLDFATSEGLTVWFPQKLLPIIAMKLIPDNFCGLPLIRLCSQKNSWLFNKIKYALDALITLPATALLLPLFAVIALAIKATSKGPVFYRANAIGKNGQAFTMFKFRSMRVDGGSDIHKNYVTQLIKGEIRPETEGGRPLKVTEDPRITKVGHLLRKSSLDELPQILNVLKGEMSLVGPRPCLPYEFELYKDWHKKRLSVRPGITGLWQVAGRSAVAFEDMVLLDLYYVYNRNIALDMNVIYETIFAVLSKRGAH
ncbi:MAG: exopolysaccharide biosynthesis polyprenyl glycosylphosphotransferase [Deltaproteobacteria bacterium]|nr:exopolysaccharide biosynthesis polyprenyl glycosylphosphotransferase [Deltaproteobacteria bacterium]